MNSFINKSELRKQFYFFIYYYYCFIYLFSNFSYFMFPGTFQYIAIGRLCNSVFLFYFSSVFYVKWIVNMLYSYIERKPFSVLIIDILTMCFFTGFGTWIWSAALHDFCKLLILFLNQTWALFWKVTNFGIVYWIQPLTSFWFII